MVKQNKLLFLQNFSKVICLNIFSFYIYQIKVKNKYIYIFTNDISIKLTTRNRNNTNLLKMKLLSGKQEARKEKKKKKIAALVEIMRLNDEDRKKKNQQSQSSSVSSGSDTEKQYINYKENVTEVNLEKLDIKNINETINDSGPERKKMKINEEILEISKQCKELNEKIISISTKNEKSKKNNLNLKINMQNEYSVQIPSESNNIILNDEQYLQLKREINSRSRQLKKVPKLSLKPPGLYAALEVNSDERVPIFLTDVQNLIMLGLLGSNSPCSPQRWCTVEKCSKISQTVVVILENVSLYHFMTYEQLFVESKNIFDIKLEVMMPKCQDGKIAEELAIVPLTNSQEYELVEKYGSLHAAIESTQDRTLMVKTVFPIVKDSTTEEIDLPASDVFPRTQLLLSAIQMVVEGYPIPLRGELASRYKNYVMTKDKYKEVTARSPMFGVDCEMCRTTTGDNELTRISIVNENLKPVYETLVCPKNKIIDYLTKYSGITSEMMHKVTKELKDVQREIRELLPADAILVGQSLNADLNALKMMHPYVIDTSVIFNISGNRTYKSKLQTLAREFLGEVIQQNKSGHDSIEDSSSSIKLVKLKLAKGIDFGDAVLSGKKRANFNGITQVGGYKIQLANNLLAHLSKDDRRAAIITSRETNFDFPKYIYNKTLAIKKANVERNADSELVEKFTQFESNLTSMIDCFRTESNKLAVRKTQEIIQDYIFSITNLNVPPEHLELSRVEKTITNIDKWIRRLWERVSHNGLFVVLLGGSPGIPSGVAMIKVKKNSFNIVNEEPVT